MRGANGAVIAVSAVLIFAGCGDNSGDGGSAEKDKTAKTSPTKGTGKPVGDLGGREAADAFTACFDLDGYSAQILPSPIGPAALIALTKGYSVTGVLLNSKNGAVYSSSVTFFASEAKKGEAKRKLKLDFGTADVPEADERGSAAVEYTTKEAQELTRGAILRCLG